MDIVSALSALAGAIIGGAITLIANLIQAKNQIKSDYIKIASELAKEDFAHIKTYAKPGQIILPIESFMTYYIKYIQIIQSKNFKIENLKQLRNIRKEIMKFYSEESSNQ